jgi:cytochrome c2
MPATEKTWRDQAGMHVIFGISALVMLAGTIWMMAKDHNREWRKWQLADRAKERWAIEAQLAQTDADTSSKLDGLRNELRAARSTKVDASFMDRFRQVVSAEDERLATEGHGEAEADFSGVAATFARLERAEEGSEEAKAARADLLARMNDFAREAKRRENALLTGKKFEAAEQTAAISARGIAVGEGRPTEAIERDIERRSAHIAELDARLAAAKDYRIALETIIKEVQAHELELEKQLAAIETELNRLRENLGRNPASPIDAPGEWINRAPVLDALYTGNIKLEQIWLPEMTINYNFSSVARYDRCIVCHRAIDKTAAGSATEPAYPAIPRDEREREMPMPTPAEPPQAAAADSGEAAPEPTIESVYGIVLAPEGQVDREAVTIQVVAPESLAALAGLETGDVIQEINGGRIHSESDVRHYLLDAAKWGEPLTLRIRRGLDQPFTSHPRLDLFVGPSSPHKKGEMGCTICHDGQGSATEFKWGSHTPNDPHQALEWSREYGWFDNHHWIFPMTPARFIESNCLKCHHEVVDLEPSERFPDPPAPKLVRGYHLVEQYGCYGCHEIPGYDGAKRIGPDLRVEPNFSEVASQILVDPGLNEDERRLAAVLSERPSDDETRHALVRAIEADAALGAKGSGQQAEEAKGAGEPRLSGATHALAGALADVDVPGRFRKAGPSLRHLASKVDFEWLYSWIRRPSDFRPKTRMPQFFLQHEHLDGEHKEFVIHDAAGKEQELADREYTERFENIEIRALAEFLLSNSQPFEYIDAPPGITESPSAERGRWLFESRGCLACHSHAEFPGIASTQGPDLSRLSAKFNSGKGQRWLYSWLRQPNHYHPRTAMPDVFLEPIAEVDASGTPTGRVTDPAADVMAFLLSVPTDWQPEAGAPSRELSAEEEAALTDLTTVWLSASFPRRRAERFAKEGIPERLAASVKVDEQMLVGMTSANRAQRQLEYVARRSLSRYGCFGCHDIPGYETAKPIGTPLASWGRKDPSQLAFENIGQFLVTHGVDSAPGEHFAHVEEEAAHGHGLDPLDDRYDRDTGFFLQALNSHQRQGFLWQKLRMPRSFDYETTRTKRYDERLRMPRFPFDAEEREAVMTFILGLTNEAPATRYIYKPDARREAIVQGRHVLDKYNCAGCHILDMERWDIAFEPDWFDEPPTTNDYPFVRPVVAPEEIEQSLQADRRGLLHATLHGMPVRDEETGRPRLVDEDGVPIEPDDTESVPYYEFQLFEPAVVSGAPRVVGLQNLQIEADREQGGPARGVAYPGHGGDLAKYIYARVIAEERKTNPTVVATEAWGWLPPPLHHEGTKVQTDWLHDFLMDPTRIRPAAVMRMPNFHMSSGEASKLVNYFAAKSAAEFPYEYNTRRRGGYLAGLEQSHPNLLGDAMRIVTDGNYCVKCHSMGDYQVRGAVKTLGPDLHEVYRRMRPEYVRRWIANPQRTLPYTGMPVNIPYDAAPPHFGGVSQQLFPGTSVMQLDGVVDLLMNFDEYAKRQTSVKSLVREPTQPAGEPSADVRSPSDRSARR